VIITRTDKNWPSSGEISAEEIFGIKIFILALIKKEVLKCNEKLISDNTVSNDEL
jgi:hypothetical protein